MKLSDNTIEVLKNFSTINPSLAFRAGNVLRTVSPQKNILAASVVEETFPVNFAIYELNQFLGLNSLFENGDIVFDEKSLSITEGNSTCRYTYTDPSMITAVPDKNLDLPSRDASFSMSAAAYKRVVNAANQLSLPEVAVRGDGGVITLTASDSKNPTANEFSQEVGACSEDIKFNFIFKADNLKFIADDYFVEISAKGISHFKGSKIQYWVATEAGSTYNA
jgi:hypothetical protein